MHIRIDALETILDKLLRGYRKRTPDFDLVIDAMREERLLDENDVLPIEAIALRTLDVPGLGIAQGEPIFKEYGYERGERQTFPERHIDAFWYEPPSERFPRLFLSELHVDRLSPQARNIIRVYTDQSTSASFFEEPWLPAVYADYQALLPESEYGAWMIAQRFHVIHYTLAIHSLRGLNTLAAFNAFLERRNFTFHGAPDKIIRSSADGLLLQSSVIPRTLPIGFANEEQHAIPGPYLAFTQRLKR
jgi:hypothetical protein